MMQDGLPSIAAALCSAHRQRWAEAVESEIDSIDRPLIGVPEEESRRITNGE
jgi:hypothetical protein